MRSGENWRHAFGVAVRPHDAPRIITIATKEMRPPIPAVRPTVESLSTIEGVAMLPGLRGAVKADWLSKKLAPLATRREKCTRIGWLSAEKPELDRE